MADLDILLRTASLQIGGLTVWPTVGGQWQVSMTLGSGSGWICETDTDVATAMRRLLRRYDLMTAAKARQAMTETMHLLSWRMKRCD